MWIFGYGSLIWRPGFTYEERKTASLYGYVRRFWQGSTDHRGVPDAPGRVLTLVEDDSSVLEGAAFRIDPKRQKSILEYLDHRESGGYTSQMVKIQVGILQISALTYIANSKNPNYLGHADDSYIAQQIARAKGPSGSNRDYVLELHRELTNMGITDPHVNTIATLLNCPEKANF